MSNDFDARLSTKTESNGGTLTGTLGAGPEIKLSTRRGRLTLRKMSAAEAASVTVAPVAAGSSGGSESAAGTAGAGGQPVGAKQSWKEDPVA